MFLSGHLGLAIPFVLGVVAYVQLVVISSMQYFILIFPSSKFLSAVNSLLCYIWDNILPSLLLAIVFGKLWDLLLVDHDGACDLGMDRWSVLYFLLRLLGWI